MIGNAASERLETTKPMFAVFGDFGEDDAMLRKTEHLDDALEFFKELTQGGGVLPERYTMVSLAAFVPSPPKMFRYRLADGRVGEWSEDKEAITAVVEVLNDLHELDPSDPTAWREEKIKE